MRKQRLTLTIALGALLLSSALANATGEHQAPITETSPRALMHTSQNLLKQARSLQDQAATANNQARRLQKQLSHLQADDGVTDHSLELLDDQYSQWRRHAGALHLQGVELEEMGGKVMAQAFLQAWPDAIKLTGPIQSQQANNTMASSHGDMDSMAQPMHDSMGDSANNSMNGSMSDPMDASMEDVMHGSMDGSMEDSMGGTGKGMNHGEMSMGMAGMEDQSASPHFNTATFRASANHEFFAHVEPLSDAEAMPRVPFNELHSWHLMLVDSTGAPVSGASIAVDGQMPGHAHGLATQPRMTEEVAPGVYRIDGMKFQMAGRWVMRFEVTQEKLTDALVFNLSL